MAHSQFAATALSRKRILRQTVPGRVTPREALDAMKDIHENLRSGMVPEDRLHVVVSAPNSCIHAIKVIELLEKQRFSSLRKYIESLDTRTVTRPSSALKKLLEHEGVQRSMGVDYPDYSSQKSDRSH